MSEVQIKKFVRMIGRDGAASLALVSADAGNSYKSLTKSALITFY
jgi:hypothetical protein